MLGMPGETEKLRFAIRIVNAIVVFDDQDLSIHHCHAFQFLEHQSSAGRSMKLSLG
jgi:hypothetical protein